MIAPRAAIHRTNSPSSSPSLLRANQMLADKRSELIAILVAPGAFVVVIESQAIFISFHTRLITVPVGESEALARDPLPVSFSVPIAGSDPVALRRAGAAVSIAETRLRLQVGDSRQSSLVRF